MSVEIRIEVTCISRTACVIAVPTDLAVSTGLSNDHDFNGVLNNLLRIIRVISLCGETVTW